MAKRFMKLKRVVIPVLVLVAMLAQATPAFAVSAEDLTDLSQQVQQVEVVTYDAPTNVVAANTVDLLGNFTDIDSNTMKWAGDALRWAVSKGVMKGTSDTTMVPGKNLSVVEFIVMLERLTVTDAQRAEYDKELVATEGTIPNVNHWAAKEMYYAREAGLLNGLGVLDTEESWKADMPRKDMAVAANNALSLLKEAPDNTEWVWMNIPDWDSIQGTPQASSILNTYKKGIIVGVDDYGTFNPNGIVTRATAAVLVQRVADATVRVPMEESNVVIPGDETAPITIDTRPGHWQDHRIPKVGDTVIKPDGTKVVLTSTKVGDKDILGLGQGCGPHLGMVTPKGGVLGEATLKGSTEYVWCGEEEGGFGTADLYCQHPVTGEWHFRSEWSTIESETYPDGKIGTKDGEYSDSLCNWQWDAADSRWYWTGGETI